MASTELQFSNEAEAKKALSEVRSNSSPTNWCLFTYSEAKQNDLDLVATGTGDVEELKAHLDESKMAYGLVRVTDMIDNSVTVKFVFIIWCGEKVSFIKKAKMTTHKGSITILVGQFHTDLNCANTSEISHDIIMNKVRDASGTAVHVKEGQSAPSSSSSTSSSTSSSSNAAAGSASPQPRAKASSTSTAKPGVPKDSQETRVISFVDEDNIRDVIRKVRANNDETDWMLIGYEGKASLKLVGHGTNGLEELIPHLNETQILYGLYRTTDTYDNTVAIKFVLILWIGEKVPIMNKARITTHKGDITTFFGQYHVDLSASDLSEINEEIIRVHIQKASGTANYVKAK